MTISLKHAKQSLKSDGVDNSLVQPSDWNDEHTLTCSANVLLGRGAGAGDAQEIAIDSVGVPVGTVLPWLMGEGTVPSGYLLCYGQNVSRTTYADLFALFGTAYGVGNGSTTFGLPDLRGMVLAGKANMGGSDKGNLTGGTTLGAAIGQQNRTAAVTGSGTATGTVSGTTGTNSNNHNVGVSGSGVDLAGTPHTHTFSASASLAVALTSATTASFSVVQPSFVVNWIVKANRVA